MGTLSGAGFSKSCFNFRTLQKFKMKYDKKLNLLFNISFINDFTNSFELTFYA